MLALQREGCIMLLYEETDSDCKCPFWICRMVISGMYFSCTWQHLAVGSYNLWWFELPSDAFTLQSVRNQPFPLPPTAPLRSETHCLQKVCQICIYMPCFSDVSFDLCYMWLWNIKAHCPQLVELGSVWSLQLNKCIVLMLSKRPLK